jgi:hypothetical protein
VILGEALTVETRLQRVRSCAIDAQFPGSE